MSRTEAVPDAIGVSRSVRAKDTTFDTRNHRLMGEKETVRRGYDDLAERYASSHSANEREITLLDRFLDSCSGPIRLLDAGCGIGTPVLRHLDERVSGVGLDFSREQLRLAAEAVPAAWLVLGDMTALPFRDDVFDVVTAYNSLIHVPLSDHQTVLDEFARVLRPGGRVLVSEASEEFERTNSNWLDSGVEMTWSMAGTEATREQLRDAGFRLTDEWHPPDTSGRPEPPFFSARLDT